MLRPFRFRRYALVAALLASAAAAEGAEDSGKLAAWLDGEFAAVWAKEGYEPQPVDEATFLRRVSLDLVGTLPSVAEARDFLNDGSPDKRDRAVDRLLADRRSAEHFARVWRRTIVRAGAAGQPASPMVEKWLADRFAEGATFDEVAKRLVAGGYPEDQPVTAAFRQAAGGAPADMADATSRVFLGVRIGCARCHDHPFAAWKQGDFWGAAAFFSQASGTGGPATIAAENGKTYNSRFLGKTEDASIPNGRPSGEVFADWMISVENPYFAATAVNRVWQQLVGRGLVTPVEDLDLAPAEAREAILDKLAAEFARSGYDYRALVAAVCKSRAYQSAGPVGATAQGARPLKVLSPEQVFDGLEQALMLPVSKGDGSPRHDGRREAFVRRLDEAAGRSPEDFQAGVPQALLMMNGRLTAEAVDLDESRTLRAVLEAPFLGPAEKIETLYLAALTRKPREDELKVMLRHVESAPERDRAFAEVFWALLNSPEFVLSR